MKKQLVIGVCVVLMMGLMGCPYSSKVPLSNVSKSAVDTSIEGVWYAKNEKGEIDTTGVSIFTFQKEYYIDVVEVKDCKADVDRYRAFITKVGGSKILNMESLEKRGEYMFLRYTVENGQLTMEVVSDLVLKENYATSKKLFKAFSSKMKEKDFFESKMVLVRTKN